MPVIEIYNENGVLKNADGISPSKIEVYCTTGLIKSPKGGGRKAKLNVYDADGMMKGEGSCSVWLLGTECSELGVSTILG